MGAIVQCHAIMAGYSEVAPVFDRLKILHLGKKYICGFVLGWGMLLYGVFAGTSSALK